MKTKLIILTSLMLLPLSMVHADDEVRPGVILYKIKDGASPRELKSLNALLRSRVRSETEISGLGVRIAQLNAPGMEISTSALLMDTGAVKFAEPDRAIAPTTSPNDPDYSAQWHHQTIQSEGAWNTLTSAANPDDVRVCVLDTGVDLDHPDLMANLLPGYNANGLASVEDANGHGSGSAGVIGAVGNNLIGVSGMLWNVGIVPIQINISDSNSSAYISTMATGIRWCADNGGKVANLSYGGAQYATIDEAATYLRNKGGLLFMSAGNDGTYNDAESYPDWSSFIIVGSTGKSDTKSGFSEYGPFIDITAPGEGIRTTYKNGGYFDYSGTSFSSPMAAGLGALIYAVDPSLTPDQVEQILSDTAVDLGDPGDDDVYGHGRIDALAAIAMAGQYAGAPNQPPIASASSTLLGTYAPLPVAFDGSASTDEGFISSYSWNFGDGATATGNQVTHTYENPGSYDAVLTVVDDRGASASDTLTIVVESDPGALIAPADLSASVVSNTVALSWTDPNAAETGYEIERAQKVRGKYRFARLKITAADEVQAVDEPGETGDYRYRVRAVGDSAVSAYSPEVSVKIESVASSPEPGPEPGTLAAPVLSYSVVGADVTLTWTHSCQADATCSYSLERGDTKVRGAINFSETYTGREMTVTLSESTPATLYFRVNATDGATVSDYSDTITVRLK